MAGAIGESRQGRGGATTFTSRILVYVAMVASLTLASCSIIPASVTISASFDPQAQNFGVGSGAISGQAFIRTPQASVKTCAGTSVLLVRDTPYSRERLSVAFGEGPGSFSSILVGTHPIANDTPLWNQSFKAAMCDVDGKFMFDGLADGSYFVIAQVVWSQPFSVYTRTFGGSLLANVTVAAGTTTEVVLAG